MRKMLFYFAFILLRGPGAAVEAFQSAHRQNVMLRCPRHLSIVTSTTAFYATSENEALKAELAEYLRKRDEVNADTAAKT
jgi:hypothetical protein